jgi:WD40-like Beta Propeller Repeat
MKKILIFIVLSIQFISCIPLDGLSPENPTNITGPEAGEYNSFDTNIVPDNFKYDIKTNQWEWKFGTNIKLELTPSIFGRLILKKNGNYEYIDINKSGTYKVDKNTKKISFTGYMAGTEGYYKIKRGWCQLIIAGKGKDGSTLSVIYEKKSDFPQPDIKEPNGGFKGTIVNMLSKSSADYIDVATGKTSKSHANISFPVTGYSKYSMKIYKKNFLDSDEIYPVIEIKDTEGNMIKKFEKTWRDPDSDKWDIGDYWYGMLSPDGSKIALVGQYKRYFVMLDPKYVDPYPMISIIDVKSGKEIYSYTLDKNGNNWGPGWSPNGELVMPRKGGGIAILDANLKNVKIIYSKNVTDANGSKIAPVKDGTGDLSIPKLFDLGWSPDGKSMAFVVEEYLTKYNVILHNPATKEYKYFSDSKGDPYQLISPFLNWK